MIDREGFVADSAAKQAISDVFTAVIAEMDAVRPWLWARSLGERHRAVLSIQAYKGGAFRVEYGVSCCWVPHPVGASWAWHRTVRQTRRDLWVDHHTIDAPPTPTITQLRGLDTLIREATQAREVVVPLARQWWVSVGSPQGVLAESQRQKKLRGSVGHWPPPELVTAFTTAELGDVRTARELASGVPGLDDRQRASLLPMLDRIRP